MSNNPPGPWTLSSGVQVLLKVYTGTILLPSQCKTIIDDYVQYNICLMYVPGEAFRCGRGVYFMMRRLCR
jgi:hypothetical protein